MSDWSCLTPYKEWADKTEDAWKERGLWIVDELQPCEYCRQRLDPDYSEYVCSQCGASTPAWNRKMSGSTSAFEERFLEEFRNFPRAIDYGKPDGSHSAMHVLDPKDFLPVVSKSLMLKPPTRHGDWELPITQYIIKQGDSYFSIAEELLGDGSFGSVLARANEDGMLIPGETIVFRIKV